jgi:Protein of unknown function (DUF2905)
MGWGPLLVGVGLFIALIGGLVWLGLPLGRLPGDLVIRRDQVTVYIPITTGILISVVLTVLGMLLRR